MPRLSVVIRYAAQNQTVSGVFVLCKIVPAVSETCWRQPVHCQRLNFINASARGLPQRVHTKPSGQRQAAKYCWQAPSVANSDWNSRKVFGNDGRGTQLHYFLWSAETTG